MAAKKPDYKSESIFQRRIRNFKKIKRAYYSLLLIVALYIISFFSPLLVNNKALAVHHNGNTYFPAIGDLFGGIIPVQYHEATFFGQTEVFGQPAHGEANYRELKKQFAKEAKGNWVLMPFYTYSPVENLLNEISQPPTKPDATHWFGTDNRGRDVFARVVYGFQISITFALLLTFFSYLLGTLVGACLGYFGGKLDIYGMRFIEVFAFIPVLFLIMILSSFLQPSLLKLVFLLTIFGGWIGITYFIRAEYFREKSKDYTAAAVAMGASDASIMFKHILPNALTPIITFAPFNIIGNITALLSLDFLGFGLRPPTPSWGELISQGMGEDISFWWLIVTPLLMMFLTLLTITFIGEGVRQAFDPREYSKLQ
ncbi:MAG: ABC transporter permease subunit [Sphingobacteriales bacterium]|jgi:microcin C transport system permease protein|nr:ABC transporter permease subunit [Sphingobacteriales bacterium]